MRLKTIVCSFIAVGLIAGGVVGCATEKQKEAKLEAKAKITRAEAEKTALSKVPGGTIKEGGIEKEKGKLIWSFDIATPGSKDITEVAVDAMTGEVVEIQKETPANEAREKKAKQKDDDEKEEKK